jgi:hypothetical protein
MSQLNPLAFSVLEKFAQVTRSLDRAKGNKNIFILINLLILSIRRYR